MALNKRGKEWEEYDNAVRWMVITVVLSVIVTIILALAAMPLGYLLGSGISKDTLNDVSKYFALVLNVPVTSTPVIGAGSNSCSITTEIFFQPLDSHSAVFKPPCRPYHRRHNQPLPFSVQHSRFRQTGRT